MKPFSKTTLFCPLTDNGYIRALGVLLDHLRPFKKITTDQSWVNLCRVNFSLAPT